MSHQVYYFKDFCYKIPGKDIKTLRLSPLSKLYTDKKKLIKIEKTYKKLIQILEEKENG